MSPSGLSGRSRKVRDQPMTRTEHDNKLLNDCNAELRAVIAQRDARIRELEQAIVRLVRSAWGTNEYNEIERIAAEIKRNIGALQKENDDLIWEV